MMLMNLIIPQNDPFFKNLTSNTYLNFSVLKRGLIVHFPFYSSKPLYKSFYNEVFLISNFVMLIHANHVAFKVAI